MKPEDLHRIITTTSMTAERLGRLSGYKPRTIEQMANGKRKIAGAVVYQCVCAGVY